METIKKIFKKIVNRETIMYIIFGVLTTVVNWIVYRIFDQLLTNGGGAEAVTTEGFQGAIDTFLSKGTAGIIAWVAAVAFAYVTNRLWVFEERAHGAKNVALECGRFVGARVATGVIEILGTPALVVLGLKAQVFGLDVAKLIVSVIIVILNYIFSKLFVFKSK
ncbi:MAG: GtrA family protein [Lachnospiraceae bacterium]|nr:GtrA family protein [Lachnospiraceae bacterium]